MPHRLLLGAAAGLAAVFAFRDTPEYARAVDEHVAPLLRRLDPETAHRAAVVAARWKLVPSARHDKPEPVLATTFAGMSFESPVGLAAGFDKHAEAVSGLLDMGFSFVEIGTVTPEPQEGNPKPRLFRLTEDAAIVNRYGFNSVGVEAVRDNLMAGSPFAGGPVGVNLGKNKDTEGGEGDYIRGIAALGPYADYLVINVSSPNTPGLRELQGREQLTALLGQCMEARRALGRSPPPPLLVKISPDLAPAQLDELADVVLASGVDGVIIANTSSSRPETLKSEHAAEAGGLSGAPVRDLSTETIRAFYARTGGRVPIIGVGGVASGADAYEKIKAGASLVQLYSAMVLEGPGVVRRVKSELAACLRRDGLASVEEAVGSSRLS